LLQRLELMQNLNKKPQKIARITSLKLSKTRDEISVALLTGGGDKPYALGLANELAKTGIALDIIGSDDLDCLDFHERPRVNFLNLRGDQRPEAGLAAKIFRVLVYYLRLILYASSARARIFHILWNNKFQLFDRTLLMFYYKILGKRIILTVHNVNMGLRDSNDTILNRLTLRIQYRLADHLFAHTEKMKQELVESFGVQGERVTIIPFGINNSVPNTALTPREARLRLGIGEDEKTILFFGNIARYKGIDYLVDAFKRISQRSEHHRLIIAGRPKNCEEYWTEVREMISADVQRGRVILREDYIPDIEIEIYFKAADVLVLPYRHIYQSGVLFLGYSFGLPVIATDVGSIRDEVVEGETGYLCRPNDPVHLAEVIERYFASDLYDNLHTMRSQIRSYAERQHSWEIVGQATLDVYAEMLGSRLRAEMQGPEASRNSLDVKRPF